MHRVLITGAGGGIGRSLRETLRSVYPVLRLSDRVPLAAARDGEEVDHCRTFRHGRGRAHGRRCRRHHPFGRHLGRERMAGRSWNRTSSALTTCSRQRGGPGSNASSSRRAIMRSAFIRATRRSTTGSCRGPTAATASARPLPRRSPASMPTSTGSAFCARASAILGRSRSTSAGCRSGSARATIPSSCASGSNTPRSATRSSTASRTTGAPGTTIPTPSGSAIGRRTIRSPLPRRCSRPSRPAADPIAERYQGGTFCAAEYTAAAPRP